MDDETGALYVNEETGGFLRYSARRTAVRNGAKLTEWKVRTVSSGDIEGISIWSGKDGKGFIVLSNQGADNYAVYRLEGDNAFVGIFHIVADPERGIDGVSETDGLA